MKREMPTGFTVFLISHALFAANDDVQRFFENDLAAYQERLDRASQEYQEEQWRIETADPKAAPNKLSEKFVVLQQVTYDKKILEKVRALSKKTDKSHPWFSRLGRALRILESTILVDEKVIRLEKENQDRQDKLVLKSNAFRLAVADEKEPISKALYGKRLASTRDRKVREKLWRQYNALRAKQWLEWGVRDLIKSRNEEARAAGFPSFYEYRFSRNQLNLDNFRSLVRDLQIRLAPKARSALQALGKHHRIGKLAPWDIRYLREQASAGDINDWLAPLPEKAALEMAADFYGALGITVDSYNFTQDLFPRAGKNTHAFAMSVVFPRVDGNLKVLPDPKMDIRFLANLKKPVRWGDVSTIIHELAHAIHAAEVRQPIALFRGIGSVETEAFAMLAERMASSQEAFETILPKFISLTAAKIGPAVRRLTKAQAIEQGFVLLRQAFFSDFEFQFYHEPDGDFSTVWAKLHKEWWGIDVMPNEADWDIDHYLMAPVYVQNYALGIIMVEQYFDFVLKHYRTSFRSSELGKKLRSELFAPGIEYDYLEFTQRFTGKPLGVEAAMKLFDG